MNDEHFAEAISEVLVTEDLDLRRAFPAEFITVDRIKAAPGWVPFSGRHDPVFLHLDAWKWAECGWCGDDFITERAKSQMSCSQPCGARLRSWKNRTGR